MGSSPPPGLTRDGPPGGPAHARPPHSHWPSPIRPQRAPPPTGALPTPRRYSWLQAVPWPRPPYSHPEPKPGSPGAHRRPLGSRQGVPDKQPDALSGPRSTRCPALQPRTRPMSKLRSPLLGINYSSAEQKTAGTRSLRQVGRTGAAWCPGRAGQSPPMKRRARDPGSAVGPCREG